jgi:hypothetical protein
LVQVPYDRVAQRVRLRQRAKREFGQEFFAPPGGGIERLPDLSAALKIMTIKTQ